MLASLLALALVATSTLHLAVAAPLPQPQGSFPSPQPADGAVNPLPADSTSTSTSTTSPSAPVDPAALSPESTSSSETTSNTSSPADVSSLLGQLGDLQGQGGTADGEAVDPDAAPSSAFASFDDGSEDAGAGAGLDLSQLLGGLGSSATAGDLGGAGGPGVGSSSPGGLDTLSGDGSLLDSLGGGGMGSFPAAGGFDAMSGGDDDDAAPASGVSGSNTPTATLADNQVLALEPTTSSLDSLPGASLSLSLSSRASSGSR